MEFTLNVWQIGAGLLTTAVIAFALGDATGAGRILRAWAAQIEAMMDERDRRRGDNNGGDS